MRHTLVVVTIIPWLAGCATLIRGRYQPVVFTSEPPAVVHVSVVGEDMRTCQTPCTMDVRRSPHPAAMQASAADRETYFGELIGSESDDAASRGLILLDGATFLPGLVDFASATFWTYPTRVHLLLPATGQGSPRAVMSTEE